MPRERKIKTLFKLCKNSIKKSIENTLVAEDLSANDRSSDAFPVGSKVSCNLFQQLPTHLLDDILSSLNDEQGNPISTKVLNHLIAPDLQNLQLAGFSDAYLSFFPNFAKLQVLNVRCTAAGDSCLRSIGIYCNELRSLNVEYCNRVTDTGTNWLCLGVESELILTTLTPVHKTPGLCKTLQHLNILHTGVTKRGIQTILKYLPSLTILDSHHTFDALVGLATRAVVVKRPGIFDGLFSPSILRTPFGRSYKSGSLQLALSLCHSISHIEIQATKGFTNRDLLSLKSIKMLRVLEIWSCPCAGLLHNTKITFCDGLAPLLKVTGRTLETLKIMCLDLIEISTIAEFCPILKSLAISNHCGRVMFSPGNDVGEFQIERYKKKKIIFKELKDLVIRNNIPSNILLLLLSSPLLADIRICDCDTLTDSILQRTAKLHNFQNLKVLRLNRSNAVSKDGLNALMTEWNSLKLIEVFLCENITEENALDWNQQAVQKNWNFKVEFNLFNSHCIYDEY